ncbi:uncharacterized protein [Centruroides vittatus]|uniref:uncharacterized protein n=1 Tax=Centruroides vittatus TaxID=120091 RepID=UPI00350F20DF
MAPDRFLDTLQNRVKKFSLFSLAHVLHLDHAVVSAPAPPQIFAFGKTHKPGQQIRPVVEKCRAPTFLLEKKLVKFVQNNLQAYPFSIKSSLQLVQKLEDVMLTDREIMTVMDFKFLYPSIKLPPCFYALRDFLFANVENSHKYHMHILELADLVCHSSFFEFDEKIYIQGRGVPMGSPMSAVLCEMVLRNLECDILLLFRNDMVIYTRYVDDIFILWADDRNIQHFIDVINHNPYGLTVELDQQSEFLVNFMDLSIACKEGEIRTSVYRKPVYHPLVIPSNSIDPGQFKMAAFRSWIRRAYTHCSSIQDTLKELAYIQKVAARHGYQRSVVDHLITKLQKNSRQRNDGNSQKAVVLSYMPFLNKVVKNVAREKNLRVIYKHNPTVYRLLRNDKRRDRSSELTGVYSIPIKDHHFNTDIVYVGATLRNLKQRIKEHKYSISYGSDSTVLATFARQQDITMH